MFRKTVLRPRRLRVCESLFWLTAALIPLASRLPATMPRLPEGETARFIDEGSESAYRGGLGEGHAVFVFNDGKTFKGGWKDNEQEGYGVMQYPEKNGTTPKYDGEWKDGKKHGAGTYTWASDSVYEGEWKDGKKHGKGKYKMYSGNVYEGDFVENKWEGKGKYTIVQVCSARPPPASFFWSVVLLPSRPWPH
eukprot:2725437-Prymnesium_polylepis.1